MLKPFSAIFLFFIFSFSCFAQEANDNISRAERGEDDNFLYRNEKSFGLFIHSAGGLGAVYRRAQHVTGARKKMFEVELQNFKHPKEVKNVTNNFSPNLNGYYYGKLNSVLLLRGGVGYQNIIYRKVDKRNVEVRYVTMAGVTLAFAKPAYLIIVDSVDSKIRTSQKYNPVTDKQDRIYGKSPFKDGLNKTQLLPAAYLKLGLSFDFSERYDAVKSLEVGTVMDAYPKALQLMAFAPVRNLLFSVYLKMTWGVKWY